MSLLELQGVDARYGSVKVLHEVSLAVGEGELVAVLGANGAGKTTTLRAVSGTVRRSGDVIFEGRRLPRRPEATARAGIAHVPEGRGTFNELSVLENLRLGAYVRRAKVKADAERVFDLFPRLEGRRNQQAGTLIVKGIFDSLERMKQKEGMSILVVEQNANLALAHAARAYVLEVGRVVVAGTSDELRANESVRKSYLGY